MGTGRLDMRNGDWKTGHEVWGLEDWTWGVEIGKLDMRCGDWKTGHEVWGLED